MSRSVLLEKLEFAKAVQEYVKKNGKYSVLISEELAPFQVSHSVNDFLQVSYIRNVISGLNHLISGKVLDHELINDLKLRFASTIVEIIPKWQCEDNEIFRDFITDFSTKGYW